MKEGSVLLIDEISLADDSVLERLNSVLEPERTLLLAEKGGGDGGQNEIEQVVAGETFRVIGTMNPGGDYGKKEVRKFDKLFHQFDFSTHWRFDSIFSCEIYFNCDIVDYDISSLPASVCLGLIAHDEGCAS